MPQNSLVSIIIPFYNREKLLPETLNSVLAQSFSNWECILVDDNSSDKSTNVVKEFIAKDARFNLYYRNDTNKPKGVSSCRNIGINNSKGDYIVFLDSDDLLDINCLENRLKYADKEPENDVWIFSMQEFNEEGLGKICNNYPVDTENKLEYLKMFLKYEIPFSVTCPLWKTSVLKELGGFDENFLRLEDPDLHCRALLSDFSFKFNLENKPDCYYRVDDSYKSRFSNKDFYKIFTTSFFRFYEKYLKMNTIHKEVIKSEIKLSALRVCKEYILVKPLGLEYFSSFYSLINKHNLFSLKELISIIILRNYLRFGLDKISGSGYFKLRKKTFVSIK
tara:strand:- start:5229 stop:6233 length:1005 start_codon:yes stop_codon:yes gene_type:complete